MAAHCHAVVWIHRHDPQRVERLAGIESVNHPSEGALGAHARHYFKAADRMRPA